MKRRSRKEIVERARRKAENRPSIRRLRELAERGQAELDVRHSGEASPRQ